MASVVSLHVEKLAGQPARLVRLPRIRVAQIVMDYLAHGWSPDEMCRHYPHLTPAEVDTAMGYYYDDHQDEIEAEIQAEVAEIRAARRGVQPFGNAARQISKPTGGAGVAHGAGHLQESLRVGDAGLDHQGDSRSLGARRKWPFDTKP